MGLFGGSDKEAKRQRKLEEERQRRITESIAKINAVFDGGTYGVNAIDPALAKWGQTYYDAKGNPLSYTAPEPAPSAPPQKMQLVGGGRAGLPTVSAPATSPVETRTATGPFISRGGLGGVGPGIYTAPESGLYSGVQTSEGFGDNFYGQVAKDYEGFYMPQIQDQYKRARRNLMVNSPSTGTSGYLRNLGDLESDFQREGVNIKARGQDAANRARTNVEQNRLDLIRMAESGSAPDVVAQQASRAKQYLAAPPAYDPVGDLFGRFAVDLANRRVMQQAGYGNSGPQPYTFSPSRSKAVTTVK